MSFYSDLYSIRQFVLDEADQMLSRGFLDQIKDVFQYLPRDVQVNICPEHHALFQVGRKPQDPTRALSYVL